jgi:C-terminal processing protease CtpA/Prc
MKRTRWLPPVLLVLLVGGLILAYTYRSQLTVGLGTVSGPSQDTVVENVRTFAKLYGYVRYFHPSDAAAKTDWSKFAVYGVRKVKDASSRKELQTELDSLFRPIAPTVQLYRTGTKPPKPSDLLIPSDTAKLGLVAWQHRGIGFDRENVPRWHRSSSDSGGTYRSIRLHRPPGRAPLFEARPEPGEVVTRSLGRGLSAQIPLALYSDGNQMLRPEDAPSPAALRDTLRQVDVPVLDSNEALRLANVTIAWNVFQHFYPYFEVVDADWAEVLRRSLQRALEDDSKRDFLQTLRRLVAQLEDGHGNVRGEALPPEGYIPVRLIRAEGEVIVAYTDTTAGSCPNPGDVVLSVDGTPVNERLQDVKKYISGSPQWKAHQALQSLGRGEPGTSVRLTLRRDEKRVECDVSRVQNRDRSNFSIRPEAITELSRSEFAQDVSQDALQNTYYVDLTRASWPEIQKKMDELARAEGVVFDLREHPNDKGGKNILHHLSTDTLRSARWQVPQITYPDQKRIAGLYRSRWTLPPKKPHIAGKIVFLTDARALSYAESVLGIVEHYDFATIVGQTTAGANGNTNPFLLPGGYQVNWTGMRVRKHDGSQHHLVGIKPDVPVKRTIEGVRSGEDEVLQKALEMLQEDNPTDEKRRSR